LKITVVVPAVLAAGIASAPVVQASPNDQYNQYMISHGMNESPEWLLQEGYNVCNYLGQGYSERSLIGQLEGDPGPLSMAGMSFSVGRAGAENIVYAAHHYLCPGA
jgi:hypothetical protein